MRKTMRKFLFAALAALTIATPVLAADTVPQRLRGTLNAYDPASRLMLVTSEDHAYSITLLADARVIGNEKASIADIKPGDFVASGAVKAPDGKLYAQELRIFPESMRGIGEGQYPMSGPNQSMTNATVEEVRGESVDAKTGTLKLTYHGTEGGAGNCSGHASAPGQGTCTGETEIVIPPNIPVTRWVLGDPSWLEAGKALTVFTAAGPNGTIVSRGVVVERNGVKPHI